MLRTLSRRYMANQGISIFSGDMEYITAFRKPEQTQYGMSCIDNVCKPLVINQFWLYDSLPDTSRMKEALAELLDGYPTLAGRISGNGIVCNNAGILWEETDCRKFRIKDISRKTMPEKRFHAVFDNKAALAGKFPLLSVKISRLEDGAVLNVKCSHFCADGNAFYTMMENWASLTRNEGLVRRPVYDDTAVRKALDGSDVYRRLASSDISTACGMLEKEGMFRIRSSAVLRMAMQKLFGLDRRLSSPLFVPEQEMACIRDSVLQSSGRKVGRNAVLCAMAVDSLKNRMGWSGKTVSMVHTVDNRGRKAGIGADYMGNASFTVTPVSFSADLPIERMALLIDEDLKDVLSHDREERYFALYCAMIERKLPYLPFDLDSTWSLRPTTLIVNNCLKFNVYGTDFGTGGPVFAWPLDFGDPVRFWPAPRGEDGVYVYFTGRFA